MLIMLKIVDVQSPVFGLVLASLSWDDVCLLFIFLSCRCDPERDLLIMFRIF